MISANAPAAGSIQDASRRRSWRNILRSVGYWTFLFVLLFEIAASIEDYLSFLEDERTYRQVYQNIDLYLTYSRGFGVFAAVALAFQLAGWRGRPSRWKTSAG